MSQEQYQTNYSEDKERREIVQRLRYSGRVYFFPAETETGFVLVTDLSTAVLVCLQDLYDDTRLDHIIDMAIEYPLSAVDNEVIQAIANLRDGYVVKDADHNLMAFYCFMADMVTLHPNHGNADGSNITFLQACREEGLKLKPDEEFEIEDLQASFVRVLKKLNLDERDKLPNNFVSEWINKWQFEAFEEVNSRENIDSAAYNLLAQAISTLRGSFHRVGQCISYARGNRDYFEKTDPEIASEPNLNDIMLARARTLAGSRTMLPHLVTRGDELKKEKLIKMINKHPNLAALKEIGQDQKAVDFGKNYMRILLESLPLETLQIIDYADYAIAHVNDSNLENIYPKEVLPGRTEQHKIDGETAAADTLSRFRLILDSNGLHHPNPAMGVLQQRIIHETGHIAFGFNGYRKSGLGYDERNARYEAVRDRFADACAKLYADKDPSIDKQSTYLKFKHSDGTVYNRKLRGLININSDEGTYTIDDRKEEMMVECLALAYTEFADPNMKNNIFGKHGANNPNFVEFRNALADVKQLYKDSALDIKQHAEQQQSAQKKR